tara:strand:- start:948 stop:2768 length:1821 start_codon:yes stop_codon:yes gene_type:complete
MHYFLRIKSYIRPYIGYGVLNIISNILSILFSLVSLTMVIPFLGILFETQEKVYNPAPLTLDTNTIKENLYAAISSLIDKKGEIEALMFICILVLIAFFLRNLFRYLALFFLTPIRNGIVHDLRMDLHKKVISLPVSFFAKRKKGDITSRLTSDLIEIEWSIMSSLEMIFKDPIQILVYLGALIVISLELTLFVLILFPITGLLIGFIGKSLKKSSNKAQSKMGELLSIINENINGLRIIKSFNIEDFTNTKFQEESAKYKKVMTSLLRKKDLSSPLSEILSTIVMVIIMWFGGQLVLNTESNLSPQEFIGYILIFSQIIRPAKSLTTSYYHIQKGSASAKRIYEILDAKNKILDIKNPVSIKKLEKEIRFKNVSFSYEKEEIIKNVDFSIKKGEVVAIIGESGSGKSTLADLLSRFYNIQKGEILIDGRNINDIAISSLRESLGLVSQESILFNDSIYNNILLGKIDAKEDEVIKAAKIANAHEFIMKKNNGYQTNIGDKGDQLSGGEKQRISIARAILKNPQILILDEATSSLDSESENLVQDALNKLMNKRTSLVIAHRLSTIQNADKIIVLEEGAIIEEGNHKDLINKSKYYKKICELQNYH